MIVKKIDTNKEQQIVSLCVYNTEFISRIKNVLSLELLNDNTSKLIVNWALKYYDQYEKAPKEDIVELASNFIEKNNVDSDRETIILSNIQNLEKFKNDNNLDFLIDQTIAYLKERNIQSAVSDIKLLIENGEIEQAEKLIQEFKPVKLIKEDIWSLFDEKDMEKYFEEKRHQAKGIYTLPGELGKKCGAFMRGDIVSIAADTKVGKSFFMQDMAVHMMKGGLNVVLFNLEVNSVSYISRIMSRVTEKPENSCNVKIPVFNAMYQIEYEESHMNRYTKEEAINSTAELKKAGGELKILKFIPYELSANDINTYLYNWKHEEGFIPDVIIVDYADIMKHHNFSDHRHQLNDTWVKLRAIGQKFNCLVFTATQVNRSGSKATYLSGEHIAEDNRKQQQVSCMIGLTKPVEFTNVTYCNIMAHRNQVYNKAEKIIVLNNFAIGKFFGEQMVDNGKVDIF